jgi:membrane-associated PAP2 superfamily phosphatase
VVQDYFYNFSTHKWILDRDLQPWKFIFYDGIKKLLIIIAVTFLISLIIFKNISIIKQYKKGIIIVVLSAIFVPLIVASLKKLTNMPCPKNEIHYGGKMIRTAVWQSYQKPYKSMKHISCWPAGHASGGFALLSLFFLFKSRKNKIFALIFGLSVGWMMGLYKMLIGDHFLSHIIITMILAWLIILLIAKIVNKKI